MAFLRRLVSTNVPRGLRRTAAAPSVWSPNRRFSYALDHDGQPYPDPFLLQDRDDSVLRILMLGAPGMFRSFARSSVSAPAWLDLGCIDFIFVFLPLGLLGMPVCGWAGCLLVAGSGKGTFCEILSKHLDLPHIATGDLVRAAAKR